MRRWGPVVLLAAWLLIGLLALVSTDRSQASLVAAVDYRVADSWLAVVMVLGGVFVGAPCLLHATETSAYNTRAGTAIVKTLRRACRDRAIAVGPLRGRPSDQQSVRAGGRSRDDEVWERYGPLLSSPEGTVAVFGLHSYPDANLTGPSRTIEGVAECDIHVVPDCWQRCERRGPLSWGRRVEPGARGGRRADRRGGVGPDAPLAPGKPIFVAMSDYLLRYGVSR